MRPTLLVIVGPTASGKSALAHKVALKFNGEIIAADSRTIYKGMDIGTAKPSKKDQQAVQYWGLDIVKPGERFTAADFKTFAVEKIADIQNMGKLPILAGGSGLYVDSILYDYSFGSKTADPINPRHRLKDSYAKNTKIIAGVCIVGLALPDERLHNHINQRTNKMFAHGVVNETKKLMLRYGKNRILKTGGIIYRVCAGHINNEYDLAFAKELNKTKEWQYARRQRTWFKRNPHIVWFGDSALAYKYINQTVNK